MEPTEKELSTFAKFLCRPEVFAQLQMNASRYLSDEDAGISYASRYFNDLPCEYKQFKPLLNTISEALANDELDLWFDFAALVATTDLFDRNVAIHSDIYQILNTKVYGKDLGPLEMLQQNYDAAKIKFNLFSAHLQFLCGSAVKFLSTKFNAADDCDLSKRPDSILCKLVNERCRRIDTLENVNVNSFRKTVIKMLFDDTVKSKNLQREICKYVLLHPELTSDESIATHWTTMYGKRSDNFSMLNRSSKVRSEPVISRVREILRW